MSLFKSSVVQCRLSVWIACFVLFAGALSIPVDSLAASAEVRATGRVVYEDPQGNTVPVRNAEVTLYDYDCLLPGVEPIELCREEIHTGQTNEDGIFDLTGTGTDFDPCFGTVVGDRCCDGIYASNCALGTPYGDNLCCEGFYERDACHLGDTYVAEVDQCCDGLPYEWDGQWFCGGLDPRWYNSYPRCDGASFPIEMVCAGVWVDLDYPDPFIQVEAISEAGTVKTWPGTVNYCLRTAREENLRDGSTVTFGDVSPDTALPCCDPCLVPVDVSTEDAAWQMHNSLLEAYDFISPHVLADPGGEIPEVTVFFPSERAELGEDSHYSDNEINITRDAQWHRETLYHEFGHHILRTFADAPSAYYWNGICDGPFLLASHCPWRPEDGCFNGERGTCDNSAHWAEGWAHFFSRAVVESCSRTASRDWETPQGPDDICPYIGDAAENCPQDDDDPWFVEGNTAAILWDLLDAANCPVNAPCTNQYLENHDENQSWDRLNEPFEVIWDVIRNYDPEPLNPLLNHPVTISQFWSGFAERYFDRINRLSEIYHENHLDPEVGANLAVESASIAPGSSTIFAGEDFTVTDTTVNAPGTIPPISTEVDSVTAFYLYDGNSIDWRQVQGFPDSRFRYAVRIGGRTLPTLPGYGASSVSTATTTVTVPYGAFPGETIVHACADTTEQVFETNEDNNCTVAGVITVEYPDNDGDGQSAFSDCDDTDPDVCWLCPEVCNDADDNCNSLVDEDLPVESYYPDGDGDGYGVTTTPTVSCAPIPGYTPGRDGDCDDTNPDVNPGMPEQCNDTDDNCNFLVDEGLPLQFYYPDGDGDGYGVTTTPTVSCAPIPGYTPGQDGDCDDTNPGINPGMPEQCNDTDDNCNSLVDEGLPFESYYPDGDGDGYGVSTAPTVSCAPIPGYTPGQDGDCDDTSPDVNPGMAEECNGEDDDCNDGIDEDFQADGDGIADCFDSCPGENNADQADHDGDAAGDVCDDCPAVTGPLCDTQGSAGESIGAGGGTFTTPDGSVEVLVPPGALEEETSISVTGSEGSFELTTDRGNATAYLGAVILPEGQDFNLPVTIVFRWPDEAPPLGKIDGTNIKEKDLIITKDGAALTDTCENDSGCDMAANAFSVQVTSLSKFTLSVLNGAPVIEALTLPIDPLLVNTPITATASFSDPGFLDTHRATWNWGDATVEAGTVTASNGAGSVTDSHIYSAAGLYTVTLTVTDDKGESASADSTDVIVYDPDVGFVTGGGWIESPAGSYTRDPSRGGKASFEFDARYRKNRTIPTGETEFYLKDPELRFHSDSYEWLVIDGTSARCRGKGTINGAGTFTFLLTAVDGEAQTTADRFGIRIWTENEADGTEEVIYDNDPSGAVEIGGGSIVIHRPR